MNIYTDTPTDTVTGTATQQGRLAHQALNKLRRKQPDTVRTPENQGCVGRGDTGGAPGTSEKKLGVSVYENTGVRHTDTANQRVEILLSKVGAKICFEDGKPVLCFEPPLEREEVDPDRWAMALELERLFWVEY